jgi:hypothetical protein
MPSRYAIKDLVFHYTGGKLMISKSWSRKSIATAVAVAVLSVYSMVVLAAPGAKASGELTVSGQVTVNGQKMISGGTVFSDSTISTAAQSSASVNISKVGRVELAPNSNLRLSFGDDSISATLETGSAQVSTLAGTTVNLTTKDGTVVVDGTRSAAALRLRLSRVWRSSALAARPSRLPLARVQQRVFRIRRPMTTTTI